MDPSYGGPCQGIRNIVPELEKLGVSNEVVCLNSPEAPYLANDPFRIHALGDSSGPWGYHKNLEPWLHDNMNRFDIVVIHGLWQYYGYVTYKVWKSLERNKERPYLLVMPHGMLDPYFQKAVGRKLKAIRNWLYWKIIEGRIINKSDGLLFTCQAELELARLTFSPYKPSQQFNVGYGILTPPVYEDDFRMAFKAYCILPENESYWLFLSRIHKKKGIDLLVNAYLTLQKQGRKLPHLVIAGPGEETEYGQEVRMLASKGQNIHFPGMLRGAAKWGAFYGAEAFILPSHQENFGIAVVEALACGKPVLISDQVNIWREILDEGAGLVGKDTEEGVVKLLTSWLLLESSAKLTMASRALATYRKYYSVVEAAKKMKSVLEEVYDERY